MGETATLAEVRQRGLWFEELGTIAAHLGFGEARSPAPVRHGDTLSRETVVTGKRLPASRPGQPGAGQ